MIGTNHATRHATHTLELRAKLRVERAAGAGGVRAGERALSALPRTDLLDPDQTYPSPRTRFKGRLQGKASREGFTNTVCTLKGGFKGT